MHRMILQVFKVLALSMVLVFVFDIVFYLYRALNLNQRMESVNVSIQKVVSENNYLPEGEYQMFTSIFNNIGNSMNGGSGTGNENDDFIIWNSDASAVGINYGTGVSNGTLPSIQDADGNELVVDDIQKPADYGDVRPIELSIRVKQPGWGFVGGLSADNWTNDRDAVKDKYKDTDGDGDALSTKFTYTYLVPCLKYQSVTAD